MIVGLDTSVVLRLLLGEPEDQTRAALARLQQALSRGHRLMMTDLVLGEAYFALCHHYGLAKDEARAALLEMASSGVIEIEPPQAKEALQPSTGAGLMDRLIMQRYKSHQGITLTFDRRLARLDGVERIEV